MPPPPSKAEIKHKAQILDYAIQVMQDLILQNKTIKMDLALTSRESLFVWVDQVVSVSTNFRDVMRSFMELFFFKRDWKYGEVWFPDTENALALQYSFVSALVGNPTIHAKIDRFREVSQPMRFTPGEDVAGRLWISTRPEWHSPISDTRTFARAREAQACGLGTCMALPLASRGKMNAVIMLFDTMERIQDDNTVLLGMDVSARIGVVCGFVLPGTTASSAPRYRQSSPDSGNTAQAGRARGATFVSCPTPPNLALVSNL
eukprot:CAMPEP_0184684948 /NCGR_PEP_ID=MMETSP0312-20130426/17216_1 /TAXON_ID=31354 /ORGANISM="Compsopogon coeruleus, Strain SAG 36.94" /LENGTH=260 /DNA_ID=CAMNT_0027138607 /DNA_START=59 /DNA_END=842 /DNA_ORIENTATION=-